MQWSIVLGGALVPAPLAPEVARAAPAPRLAARLRRARIGRHAADGHASHLAWAAGAFGVAGEHFVGAPYAAQDIAGLGPWFCDPVHLEVARDHIVLHLLDPAPLQEDEASALLAAAAPITAAHGCHLTRIDGQWFAGLPRDWSIEASPLPAVAGRSIEDQLPSGTDAPRWRRLLTEIQMQWHEHPVNLARAEREQLAVNGLWLHGGGTATKLPPGRFAHAVSRDPYWRAWGAATGATPANDASAIGKPRGNVIEDCELLLEPARAEHWGLWLARLADVEQLVEARCTAALATGATVELVFCGETVVRTAQVKLSDRFRPWRQHRLEQVIAEDRSP